MKRPERVRFVTFYSYKGGVGRTMALANVACQLAIKHGKRVVAIDWDLEAPGLHYYFDIEDEQIAERDGLLDYLRDFQVQVSRGSEGKPPPIGKYILDLPRRRKQRRAIERHGGSVRLMHCGRVDADFDARRQAFDWSVFYRDFEGYRIIEMMKRQLIEELEADLVLIDARAGQSDIGTTPTIQIPDAVVLLFTSNQQSLEGTVHVAERLAEHPWRRGEGGEVPEILPIPARVFPREETFQSWLHKEVRPRLASLVETDVLRPEHVDPEALIRRAIAVDAKHSVGESLAILSVGQGDAFVQPYIRIAQAIENLFQGREAYGNDALSTPELGRLLEGDVRPPVPEPPASPEALDELQSARSELEAAASRGDERAVARIQLKIGELATKTQRFHEAEANLQAVLTFAERESDDGVSILAHTRLVDVYNEQGLFETAREHARRARFLLDEKQPPELRMSVFSKLYLVEMHQERWVAAEQYARELLTEARAADQPSAEIAALTGLAAAMLNQGHSKSAEEYADQGLRLIDDVRFEVPVVDFESNLRAILGLALYRRGDIDGAIHETDTVIGLRRSLGRDVSVFETMRDRLRVERTGSRD